jgi:glutamate-1-semialdehyde aminotransferase
LPAALTSEYQRLLRENGVDVMSSTGGVVSAAHTENDIDEATAAFEKTVVALRDKGLVQTL